MSLKLSNTWIQTIKRTLFTLQAKERTTRKLNISKSGTCTTYSIFQACIMPFPQIYFTQSSTQSMSYDLDELFCENS